MIIVSVTLFTISNVLGIYYDMCTLSWLMINLLCYYDDSILYKKKKGCHLRRKGSCACVGRINNQS
jgi:hypothetical protein